MSSQIAVVQAKRSTVFHHVILKKWAIYCVVTNMKLRTRHRNVKIH